MIQGVLLEAPDARGSPLLVHWWPLPELDQSCAVGARTRWGDAADGKGRDGAGQECVFMAWPRLLHWPVVEELGQQNDIQASAAAWRISVLARTSAHVSRSARWARTTEKREIRTFCFFHSFHYYCCKWNGLIHLVKWKCTFTFNNYHIFGLKISIFLPCESKYQTCEFFASVFRPLLKI